MRATRFHKKVKARKRHICQKCNSIINKGDLYYHTKTNTRSGGCCLLFLMWLGDTSTTSDPKTFSGIAVSENVALWCTQCNGLTPHAATTDSHKCDVCGKVHL